MTDDRTTVVDPDTGEILGERPLTRGDMLMPNALEVFQNKGAVGNTQVPLSGSTGTINFSSMLQIMEFAKLMAVSGVAVPKFLRANPGACLAVTMQANEWAMSPFAVANKSYSVNDRIAYESQLVHAVIERRAPLKDRLNARWDGDLAAGTRRCIVVGHFQGETDPREWASPEIGKIKIKNSPEWISNPDKQLFYHASRDWARIWAPDVLLGIYTRDEMMAIDHGPTERSGGLAERLPPKSDTGFDSQGIATTLASARGGAEAAAGPAQEPIQDVEATEVRSGDGRTSEAPSAPDGPTDSMREDFERTKAGWANAQPATKDEYAEYFDWWLGEMKSRADAEARWESERPLRASLKVLVQPRKAMERKLNERFS